MKLKSYKSKKRALLAIGIVIKKYLFLDGINFHTGWFSIHNDIPLVPSLSYMLHFSCCDQDIGLEVKLNC